ncbi:MAG: FAD-dependent oxidoreductase [Bordetella sp.]|nr:FAD-dependent oxidoreductase [Bordetella sp.]
MPSSTANVATGDWDVIVVGAGAAGMTAACTAAADGASVLLLEQGSVVGGTTAISGGMVWIPANHKMPSCGREDSLATARQYLRQAAPDADPALMDAFLQHGDAAIRHLEGKTSLRLRPVVTYPDYYPHLVGATLGGRVLEPEPFEGHELGADFSLLRDPLPEFTLFGGMMISRQDIPHLRRAGRSLRSTWHVAKLLLAHARQRMGAHRGTTLYLGNALAARLLLSARRLGVEIRTGVQISALRKVEDRITGVEVAQGDDAPQTLGARRAVILATGGISHASELRARHVPPAAGSLTATVRPGNATAGALLAQAAGASMSVPTGHGAFWVPASTFTRADGSPVVYPHTVADRGKPGVIAIDRRGMRFVNEALSYHEFVRAQLANADTAIPAWLVCDRRFLWKYGLGRIKPFTLSVGREIAEGYLWRADTLEQLALRIDVPQDALVQTLARYNDHALRGEDPDFGKGSDAYQRHLGDADQKPNPCIAPITRAPFYAIQVRPADLGMSAGLRTDVHARVLDASGQAIAGLYACGNDMASVMAGAYPGPGITLGPALTFGWIAARHALGRHDNSKGSST